MERSKGTQSGLKRVMTAMFLAAALASTGCGQNALLNPTAGQVQAAGTGSSSASTASHDLNPAGHEINP
jgi:hypothetical protein